MEASGDTLSADVYDNDDNSTAVTVNDNNIGDVHITIDDLLYIKLLIKSYRKHYRSCEEVGLW